MAKRKTDPTRKRFQGGGKVQGKARSLANKNDLQLALALNQVREARSRSIPLGREDDLASYLGSLSNNELAQLQRATEARQGVKQALGPNVPLLDRAVGVGNTASNLVFDALKSTGLLPLAGRGYDWVTGGTQGAELTTSSPGTSTDQWGNIKATLQGVGQGLGDVGSALGLPSVARPAASRFSVTSPPGTAGFIRGQTGGQVPSKPNSFIRVPAKDIIKAQRGLQVPSGNIRGNQGISSQTPTQSNVVGQTIDALGQIKPDTSQLSATAGKLAGFNPLAGAAGSTLQGIISTGSPVDVSPITQVAQQQAARTYGDLSGGINEQLGALNLGSSTARTNALAREAGRLAQGVGETGILAGVQAQEAARGRQLAAFNPLLGASGQQLSGLQAAGGLQGEAAQLGLQGQIAKAGGFGNLSGQLIPPTVGVNQQPPPRAFGGSGASGTGFGRRPSFGFGESMGRMAAGGRVDMGDYLANLTFGQQFTRPEAVPQAPMRTREYQPTVTRQGQPMFNPKDLMSQSRSARPDYIAQYVGDQMRRGGFNPLGFGGYSMTNALKQAAFSSPGGGSAGVSSRAPRPRTSANGYTHAVENTTMRASRNASATMYGTRTFIAQVKAAFPAAPNLWPAMKTTFGERGSLSSAARSSRSQRMHSTPLFSSLSCNPSSLKRATPMTRRRGTARFAMRARVGPILPPTPSTRMSPGRAREIGFELARRARHELLERCNVGEVNHSVNYNCAR